MKLPLLVATSALLLFVACKKDKEEVAPPSTGSPSDLRLVATLSAPGFQAEVINDAGALQVGYNKLQVKVTDADGTPVNPASLEWYPQMTMNMDGMVHQHSCPYSTLAPAASGDGYEGHIVFNMASDGTANTWALRLTIHVDGTEHELTGAMNVANTETAYHKVFTTGMGTDGELYLLALMQPASPVIGVNTITAGLYRMDSDGSFPVVDGYTIQVDPRMPGMGNHGAPGNADMVQQADGLYRGAVGFSMTGYWKINLVLRNGFNETVLGEPVTTDNPASSLHFKVEF